MKKKDKPKCESHSPIYDMQTGGSKCKTCGTLLNDFNQEYSEVKESRNGSVGDSHLNTAHPATSDKWKEVFKEWYINTSGQNYMPYEILEAHIERYIVSQLQQLLSEKEKEIEYLKQRCDAAEKLMDLQQVYTRSANYNNWNKLKQSPIN